MTEWDEECSQKKKNGSNRLSQLQLPEIFREIGGDCSNSPGGVGGLSVKLGSKSLFLYISLQQKHY